MCGHGASPASPASTSAPVPIYRARAKAFLVWAPLKGREAGEGTGQHSTASPASANPDVFPVRRRFSIGIPDVSGRNSGCLPPSPRAWVEGRQAWAGPTTTAELS